MIRNSRRLRALPIAAAAASFFVAGCTSLNHSARIGDLVSVEQKVSGGANVNVADDNNLGESPLFWAVLNGNTEIARYLIEHGANVNAADSIGSTPVQWAALGGQAGLVKLLASHGADVNAADSFGDTALHLAADAGRLDAVNALLASGANPSIRDSYGQRPMDLVCAEWQDGGNCPREQILTALRNGPAVPAPAAAAPAESAAPAAQSRPQKTSPAASGGAAPWWKQ